jgi:predicted HicB family RNase H-like nuclease
MIDRTSGAAPSTVGKQQFNVYLPPALIREVKYRALDDQISLSELVERALIAFLETGARHD